MRRTPLSLDEHRQLGRELYAQRSALITASVELSNRYGTSSKVGRLARRALADLDALRCELDNQLARDHPDEFEPSVYYPAARRLEGIARER